MADERKHVVAADRRRARTKAAPTIGGTDTPRISEIDAQSFRRAPLHARGVIRSLILPERRDTDETPIQEFDPLATKRRGEAMRTGVADLRAVQLDIARIGNEGELGESVCATIIVLDQGSRRFTLHQHRPSILADFDAGTNAQGDGVRITIKPLFLDGLVSEPRIKKGRDGLGRCRNDEDAAEHRAKSTGKECRQAHQGTSHLRHAHCTNLDVGEWGCRRPL